MSISAGTRTASLAPQRGPTWIAEGKLAGSTLTLDRALKNIVAMGVPLPWALRMVTSNPARQIGLGERKGILATGADADIVFLDERLDVSGVMTRGVASSW